MAAGLNGTLANMTGGLSMANPFASEDGAKVVASLEILANVYVGTCFLFFGRELEQARRRSFRPRSLLALGYGGCRACPRPSPASSTDPPSPLRRP